jgi:O-antigen/teichoic acid export membrane protein
MRSSYNVILRKGGRSLFIRLLGVSLVFATSIVLARNLGAEGYGAYSYIYSLVILLTIPSQFGVPMLLIREIPGALVEKKIVFLEVLISWSATQVLLASLVVFAGFSIVVATLFRDHELSKYMIIAATALPLLSLSAISAAAIRAEGWVILGQISETVVRPLLFVVGVLAIKFLTSEQVDLSVVVYIFIASAGCSCIVSIAIFCRKSYIFRWGNISLFKRARGSSWGRSAFPLALISGVAIINSNVDVIVLSQFTAQEDVGLYRVATQGALLCSFSLQAMNLVCAPQFAKLYFSNKKRQLQNLVGLSATVLFVISLVIAATILIFKDELLLFVYGSEFVGAGAAMSILIFGQVVNSLFGLVGALMGMTGNHRQVLIVSLISLVLNIVVSLLLVPVYGVHGAAISTALSLTFWNVSLWYCARRCIGVEAIAFGFLVKSSKKEV